MGVIDIVLVCCLLPAVYFGIKHGLVRQLVAVAVIYFGISLSLRFSIPVAEWVAGHLHLNEFWAKTVSFILIFFVVALGLSLLGKVVEKILQISLLGWLNKLLGVLTALFVFMLVLSALVYLVDSANNLLHFIPSEKIEDSRLYSLLLDFAKAVFPRIKGISQTTTPVQMA